MNSKTANNLLPYFHLFHLPQRPYLMHDSLYPQRGIRRNRYTQLLEAIAYVTQYEDDFIREAAETDT